MRVMSKSLTSSTQNPRTFKHLKENEGHAGPTNCDDEYFERDDQDASGGMGQRSGAANPGCLTSRTGMEQAEDTETKENMTDMRQKLQSIQTGKAYLEKKIQEYEARLSQMKTKKDMSDRARRAANNASTTNSQTGLGMSTQGAGMHTSCLLYTSPSPRDATLSRMPSSA